jgi:hypothetical protein
MIVRGRPFVEPPPPLGFGPRARGGMMMRRPGGGCAGAMTLETPFALALAEAEPTEETIAPDAPRLIDKATPDPVDIARTTLAPLAELVAVEAPDPRATAEPVAEAEAVALDWPAEA